MRTVPSPTTRSIIAGLFAGLAASFVLSSPASAVTPPAPGNFTGYGFDACVAPNQTVMDAWNLKSPYSAIGIYISGHSRYCGDAYQPNLSASWVATNASRGWRFMPIHVGYQAPCFVNNPASRVQKKRMSADPAIARQQARSDVAETISALQGYGFPAASVSYLDIEWYDRTNTTCDTATLAFIDEWTERLHLAGFRSGLYSSGSAAIKSADVARTTRSWFTEPDHLWIAWGNGIANTDGGPYVSDSAWADHQRIHQYELDATVTYGGYRLNIDKNFLDVGRGSVPTAQEQPCGVRLSFASYFTLRLGDKGLQVSALQCLLKQRGYFTSAVDGTFGSSTRYAVDAYRVSLGWSKVGRTTPATWTALLSAGTRPRVLKQGSVGEPVWRLQRALVAAGAGARITGVYDATTVAAVKRYRARHGLASYSTTDSSVWSLLQRGKVYG